MKSNYQVKDRILLLPQGRDVEFDFPIAEVVECDNCLVIRLDVPSNVVYNQNVFGVSTNGVDRWQIGPERLVYDNSPYTHISLSGNTALLQNWDGLLLEIEPKNGEVLSRKYLR